MTILLISGIFPPDIGGPATYVPALARGLQRRGYRARVLTLSESSAVEDGNFPFEVDRVPRQGSKGLRFLRVVKKILRLGRPADLLFVNGLFLEATAANLVLRKPLVAKIVGDWVWERATNRGWTTDAFDKFQRRRHGPALSLFKALRSACARRAERVIVPSAFLARAVTDWGVPPSRIVTISNAPEPTSSAPLSVPLATPVKVVTVGRLVPWKRIDRVISALARCPQAGLVVVGDGPERGSLERLAKTIGIGERTYFAGSRSRAETLGLVAACDLFVLSSTYEGLPHVVLEAMSLGIPVIATSAGGSPEVVHDGENGRLVPPTEGDELASVLAELVTAPLERRRLADGARRSIESFSFEQMIAETAAVIQSASAGSQAVALG